MSLVLLQEGGVDGRRGRRIGEEEEEERQCLFGSLLIIKKKSCNPSG
jgi:hypothetical protein